MEIKIGTRVIKNSRYDVPLDKQSKIYTVLSEPWTVGGKEVVKISGEAAGYALDGLTPVDDSTAWVSVKDRLPDKRGYYLCHSLKWKPCDYVCEFIPDNPSGSQWHMRMEGWQDGKITHWMPRPAPPEEVEHCCRNCQFWNGEPEDTKPQFCDLTEDHKGPDGWCWKYCGRDE